MTSKKKQIAPSSVTVSRLTVVFSNFAQGVVGVEEVEAHLLAVSKRISSFAILGRDARESRYLAHRALIAAVAALRFKVSEEEIQGYPWLELVKMAHRECALSDSLVAAQALRHEFPVPMIDLLRVLNPSEKVLNQACKVAADRDNVKALRGLLEFGASPDGDGDGSPLACALRGGKIQYEVGVMRSDDNYTCISLLLDAGADLRRALCVQIGVHNVNHASSTDRVRVRANITRHIEACVALAPKGSAP